MPAVAKKKRQPAKPSPVDDEPHRFRVPDGPIPLTADPPKSFAPDPVIDLRTVAHEPEVEPVGIVCRDCGCRHFYVVKIERPRPGTIRRRRECRHCGRRITTNEREAFT